MDLRPGAAGAGAACPGRQRRGAGVAGRAGAGRGRVPLRTGRLRRPVRDEDDHAVPAADLPGDDDAGRELTLRGHPVPVPRRSGGGGPAPVAGGAPESHPRGLLPSLSSPPTIGPAVSPPWPPAWTT